MSRSAWRTVSGLGFALFLVAACAPTVKDIAGKPSDWLLEQLDEERDSIFRARVVEEIALQRDPALLPYLCRAAGDRDARVKGAAVTGLVGYGGHLNDEMRDEVYLAAMSDPVRDVRDAALKGLAARVEGGRQPPQIVKRLLSAARKSSDGLHRLGAVQTLAVVDGKEVDEVLMEVARLDSNAEVRRTAVVALGLRGVEESRELLNRIRARDLSEQVRVVAERALAQIGGKLSEEVIAVMPFETSSSSPAIRSFCEGLPDYLSAALARGKVATVVERKQVAAVMAELVYQDAQIDDGKAVQIGLQLRASQVVYGSLQQFGADLVLIAKRVDVRSHEVLQSVESRGARHDMESLQREVAEKLVRSF